MNVKNPDLALVEERPLENSLTAVVVGNPIDSWTLVSWAGVPVNPKPSLGTEFYVDVRDYAVVWQRAIWNVTVAQQTGDPVQVLQALGTGVGQIATATVKLPGDIVGSFADSVVNALQPNTAATVALARALPKASVSAPVSAARTYMPDKAPSAAVVGSRNATGAAAAQRPPVAAGTSASQQQKAAKGRPTAATATREPPEVEAVGAGVQFSRVLLPQTWTTPALAII